MANERAFVFLHKIDGCKEVNDVAVTEEEDLVVTTDCGVFIIKSKTNAEITIWDNEESICVNCVAIDAGGNVLVTFDNYIKYFSRTSSKTIGSKGHGPLQFETAMGIMCHPHNHKVYVADQYNERIQILNPDFTYDRSFGMPKGSFKPHGIASDRNGHVYVTDQCYGRVVVFSVDGNFQREFRVTEFSETEKTELELYGIAIDSKDLVYVSVSVHDGTKFKYRVSVFFTDGEFVKSFNDSLSLPKGLAIGGKEKTNIYVCDYFNNCIKVFEKVNTGPNPPF